MVLDYVCWEREDKRVMGVRLVLDHALLDIKTQLWMIYTNMNIRNTRLAMPLKLLLRKRTLAVFNPSFSLCPKNIQRFSLAVYLREIIPSSQLSVKTICFISSQMGDPLFLNSGPKLDPPPPHMRKWKYSLQSPSRDLMYCNWYLSLVNIKQKSTGAGSLK